MDRTVGVAAVVFVALAVVGLWIALSPTTLTSDTGAVDALRSIGAAMFGGALAAFLVAVYHWDFHRRRG